ncbi:unnamed protein product [Fraxinus pennsylvanica]|uniref:histone deacetylase n=1 Tax=Fraxinus pennsylvanica TaxID=56036 RepID=A0AAD2DTV1_9LAMI|nr:unnamed protein product [Fraxinus pennsylvanica]
MLANSEFSTLFDSISAVANLHNSGPNMAIFSNFKSTGLALGPHPDGKSRTAETFLGLYSATKPISSDQFLGCLTALWYFKIITVIPNTIASEFAPNFTIISAGFVAATSDPLGCCDVTPTGYAQMTQMYSSSTLSGEKLLVILEDEFNLRSISSSATVVIKQRCSSSDAAVGGGLRWSADSIGVLGGGLVADLVIRLDLICCWLVFCDGVLGVAVWLLADLWGGELVVGCLCLRSLVADLLMVVADLLLQVFCGCGCGGCDL